MSRGYVPSVNDREALARSTGVRWRHDGSPADAPTFEAAVLGSAPIALVVVDVERDRLAWVNRRAEALLGLSREHLQKLKLNEWVAPDVDGTGRVLLGALRAALAVAVTGEPASCELPLLDGEGRAHWMAAELQKTFGSGSLVTCALTKLPPVPALEPELGGSSERLRLVLESTREGFWDWDIESGRVFFSDQWLENLGYSPGELPARVETWQMLIHPDDAAQADEVLRSRLDGDTPVDYSENRLLTKSGQYRWFADRGRVVARGRGGEPLRMVGTDADITELREAHEGKRQAEAHLARSERLASVGMMAAGVAHEINNPLAYILNNVDFALKQLSSSSGTGQVDAEALSALAEAREGAVRVRDVVKDLRTFSRVGDEQPQWVEVREVLDSSLNIARRQILECAKLEVDFSTQREVRANRSRLGQVFLNLLVNACEAIEPGDPEGNTISVGCRENDEFVEVTVRDTGVGIPPGDIHRIFDLFYTTKPVGVGTGLGLSICHDLVEALGGSIHVTSDVGRGTQFRVLLPCAEAQPSTRRSVPEDANVWTRARRMLVVDDDPLVARSVRRLLGDRQDVTLVNDGASALAELRRSSYDVVLCDVAMPGMDGITVLEAAHTERLSAAHRFVFMTGSLFSQEWRQRMNAVRAPCVAKPLDIAELTAAVAQVLARGGPNAGAPEAAEFGG
jgi:PAS domain S-box-containing protein